jgi:hypothetical protein
MRRIKVYLVRVLGRLIVLVQSDAYGMRDVLFVGVLSFSRRKGTSQKGLCCCCGPRDDLMRERHHPE